MGIGAADEAELEGVYAERRFELQALGECLAGIFVFDHAGLLRNAGEVGRIPFFEIRQIRRWVKARDVSHHHP